MECKTDITIYTKDGKGFDVVDGVLVEMKEVCSHQHPQTYRRPKVHFKYMDCPLPKFIQGITQMYREGRFQ